MARRTPFPGVFWVANLIEVLERFSYYGIYFGFGIYMTHPGFTRDDLGIVQSIFLTLSYSIPIISGTFVCEQVTNGGRLGTHRSCRGSMLIQHKPRAGRGFSRIHSIVTENLQNATACAATFRP